MDLMAIEVDRERDPNGAKLRAVLEAHFEYERSHSGRMVFVHLLALAGAFATVCAAWPSHFAVSTRHFAALMWFLMALGACLTTTSEVRWYRRYERCLRDTGGRVVE